MATTRISDIYEPTTFNQGVDEASTIANRFYQSGVMQRDGQLDGFAAGPGRAIELPFYKPLADVEPNYSSDDPTTSSTPQKMSGGLQMGRKAFMNQSWSAMDLARELALKDPLDGITQKIGVYWATQIQKRTIQSLMGVLADNVANDGEDMVYSVATDAAGAPTADEKISGEAVLAAKQTMGDAAGELTGIALHSVLYTSLQSQNLIQYERDPETGLLYPTYLGYNVIVDDGMPAVAGTNRITYTAALFGTGAMLWGYAEPDQASEIDRKPETGNGGGQEIIYSRRQDIIHPVGFAFTGSSVAGESPTLSELATAGNWNRVYERKSVPIAFLQVNG